MIYGLPYTSLHPIRSDLGFRVQGIGLRATYREFRPCLCVCVCAHACDSLGRLVSGNLDFLVSYSSEHIFMA